MRYVTLRWFVQKMHGAQGAQKIMNIFRGRSRKRALATRPLSKRRDEHHKNALFYHRAIWRASGRSPDWLKMENANAPAVKREEEEEWGKMKWRIPPRAICFGIRKLNPI